MDQKKLEELEKKIKQDYKNIIGIVVQQDGRQLYENHFHNCTASSQVHIYSVTKSIVSILIGIALDHKLIKNVDQKVLDFFPDYIVKKRERIIQDITIKDLLTMTAPFKYRIPPYKKYFTSDSGLQFSLDLLGGRKHTGEFRYTPLIGPDILSGILVQVSGQSVYDFAVDYLFSPLGIEIKNSFTFQTEKEYLAFNRSTEMSGWSTDASGLHTAGWGLTLSAGDMAKIGQLYLNGGTWGGERIVSEKWVKESTTEHSRRKKYNLAYGYLWWVNEGTEPGYAAMGDGGNIIYVNTRRNMVVSITALFKPRVMDRIEFIREYVEPIFS